MNLYGFVGNDGVGEVDVLGLDDASEWLGELILDGLTTISKKIALTNGSKKCDELVKTYGSNCKKECMVCTIQMSGYQPIQGGGVDAVEQWATFFARLTCGGKDGNDLHTWIDKNLMDVGANQKNYNYLGRETYYKVYTKK